MFLRLFVLSVIAAGNISAQAVASAQSSSGAGVVKDVGLNTRIDVNLDDVTLDNALRSITRQANLVATFGYRVNEASKKVTLKESGVTVAGALRKALKGTNITFRLTETGHVLFVRLDQKTTQVQGVVSGKVTDSKTGRGISGATVTVDNGSHSAITGEDGVYRVAGIGAGTHTLTVRLVGYAKQTRTIIVGEGATITADFKLEPSANVLDQVIVTGTVAQTELKAVPNAITVITAKQIEDRGITRIAQLFRGDVPGMFAENAGTGSSNRTIMGGDENLLDEFTMFHGEEPVSREHILIT